MNQDIIVGISVSTRMLGLAIFSNSQLIEFQSKLLKEKWTDSKPGLFIANLASCTRHFTINRLVLSIPEQHYRTIEFEKLYQAIKKYAYEKKITIKEVPRPLLRKLCMPGKKKNKESEMATMVQCYNELLPIYEKEMLNKNKYYEKAFEAVGSVMVHQNTTLQILKDKE